jgi:transposase
MAEEKTTTERPSGAARPGGESGAAALGRGGRMSRLRKMAAVLRLLRGEDLELSIRFAARSRGLGVTAATLSQWREAFLAAGEAALTSRPEWTCSTFVVRLWRTSG